MKCVNTDGDLETENPCIFKCDLLTLEQGGSNTAVTIEPPHSWKRGESDRWSKVFFHNKTGKQHVSGPFFYAQHRKPSN